MRNFIEVIPGTGDGRCRSCDFRYSVHLPREVAEHREHHRKFLAAVHAGWAPVNDEHREQWLAEGERMQRHGDTLEERVAGAEKWLLAKHHEHLARVLLFDVPRMDLRTFFTRMEADGLEGRFAGDVAAVLRERYSDKP